MSETGSSDNVIDTPLINPEEETHLQSGSINPPPPTDYPQTPPTEQTCQPTALVLLFGQQEVQSTLCEQLPALPSIPPNPFTLQLSLPPTDTQGTAPSATVAGTSLLPVDLLELMATLQQATRHLVLLPRAHVSPIEEVTHNHSTAELVSGRGLPVPMELLVVSGDRLFLDRTAVEDSSTREDYC